MKIKGILIALICLAGLLLSSSIALAQDVILITNKNTSVDTVTKNEVSNWFLKKNATWSDGSRVTPVDNATMKGTFCNEFHGRSAGAIKSFWQKQIFSGKNTPPVEKRSDADVIAYIVSNPGAIGYVSAKADISEVKKLETQ